MIVRVLMLAYGEPGEVREVVLPPEDHSDNVCEAVFYWGQNDFQPQQHPSVSVGDVIDLGPDNGRFLVATIGFYLMDDAEYQSYVAMSQSDRITFAYSKRMP